MADLDPLVARFLDRLVTVAEYAKLEKISVTQAHRRMANGVVQHVVIRERIFVVLPETR